MIQIGDRVSVREKSMRQFNHGQKFSQKAICGIVVKINDNYFRSGFHRPILVRFDIGSSEWWGEWEVKKT